tara:strand:+ start:1439 stop:1840 length:402 start_codon:yes stop_codon:yes gene_type:complete
MNKDLKETGDVIDGSSGDMSQERSGIYQDRVNGKLPMDRVKGHYQMRDAKIAQVTGKQMMNDLKAAGNFIAGGGPIKDMVSSGKAAYNEYIKPGVDKVIDAKNKTFGPNFIKKTVVGDIKSSISGVKKALKKD